ncbi:SGNH/GDSL hydrolase family protein [Allonocardiopsis opalescens]|uniref:Lysophospholipase L1-like esterase n=1 Tax=Allonocardiopsis opalescens TaxID=1144618 RepID=A0A2T0PVU8_9ACTN|nr:SGNH/GDSL hydrolase family protein [Allonocardiopsis opalescens]PRX95664.1 lysophospholipase L1-like esterase [Allonocardiopsis opalescens]
MSGRPALTAAAQALVWLSVPLLYAQGRGVRGRVPRLPEAAAERTGAAAGPAGAGAEPLRLLVLGESTAAGVGVDSHRDGLAGGLAAELAARTGRAVTWSVLARSGATAADSVRLLLPPASAGERPDLVLLAHGVNDLLRLTPLRRFERALTELARGLRAAHGPVPLVYTLMPPMRRFPTLPEPLRSVLGLRADALDLAIARVAARLPAARAAPTPAAGPDATAFFAADGFHPGPTGYHHWAAALAGPATELLGAGAVADSGR